jgi:hypothetical protein
LIVAVIAGGVAVALLLFLLVNTGSSKPRRLQVLFPPSTAPPSAAVPPLPLACPPPSHTPVQIFGEAELKQRLVGTWLMCQGGRVNGMDPFQSDEMGLQILGDGTWRKLRRNPAGQLQVVPGSNNYGNWTLLQTTSRVSALGRLEFKTASGGYSLADPRFFSGPAMMELNGSTYYVPTSVSVLPAPAATAPQQSCNFPSQQRAPAPSARSLIDHLVGTWLVCGTPSIFGTGEVGMSIAVNQTWTKLTTNAAGQLVPMTGSADHGTWNVFASNNANIPGPFMLAVSFTDGTGGGYTYDLGPLFGSAPATMQITVTSTSDYVLTTRPVVQAKR